MKAKVTGKIIVIGEFEKPEDIEESVARFKKYIEDNLHIDDEHRIEMEFEIE